MADYLDFSRKNPQLGSYLQTEYVINNDQAAFDIYLLAVYLCKNEDTQEVQRLYSLIASIYRKGLEDGRSEE